MRGFFHSRHNKFQTKKNDDKLFPERWSFGSCPAGSWLCIDHQWQNPNAIGELKCRGGGSISQPNTSRPNTARRRGRTRPGRHLERAQTRLLSVPNCYRKKDQSGVWVNIFTGGFIGSSTDYSTGAMYQDCVPSIACCRFTNGCANTSARSCAICGSFRFGQAHKSASDWFFIFGN